MIVREMNVERGIKLVSDSNDEFDTRGKGRVVLPFVSDPLVLVHVNIPVGLGHFVLLHIRGSYAIHEIV